MNTELENILSDIRYKELQEIARKRDFTFYESLEALIFANKISEIISEDIQE